MILRRARSRAAQSGGRVRSGPPAPPSGHPIRGSAVATAAWVALAAGCTIEPAAQDAQQAPAVGVPPSAAPEALGTAPARPYSEAVRVGSTYYFSGKIGATDSTRALTEGRTAAETRNILEAFRTALTGLGLDFSDVVSANVYLTDVADYDAMNEVYGSYFPTDPPARTTVAVAALPLESAIEISFIAVASPD